MKIRSYMVVLVLAAVLPVVVFSGSMVVRYAHQERVAIERGLQETVRALSIAVDRELQAAISTMEALALTRELDTGNLATFYDEAVRVLRAHRSWATVSLYDPQGRQLLNLSRPLGEALPPATQGELLGHAVETGEPAVSDLFTSRTVQAPVVALEVPVVRDGELRYVLAVSIRPATLVDLLAQQKLPADAVATIVDRRKIIIARTRAVDRYLGRPTTNELATRSTESAEGTYKGSSMEGDSVYIAFARSRLSGWTVAAALPTGLVESRLRLSVWMIVAHGLLFVIVGVVLAALLGRRMAQPILALRGAAAALERGTRMLPAPRSPIREVNDLCVAVDVASRLLEGRSERLTLQYEVSRVLADSATTAGALSGSLRAACAVLGWEVGELWLVESGGALRRAGVWHAPSASLARFVAENGAKECAPGVGLCGRVRALSKPVWIPDIQQDRTFTTRAAADAGVRCAAGVPVCGDGELLGVLVLFAQHVEEADDELVNTLVNIGTHLGQFVQRKRAEEERAQLLEREQALRAEAESANRAKDEFLATLSHELRTPLQSMLGWIQVLRSGRLQDQMADRALETIERNTRVQAQLIDDLLDISRIIAGKLRLEFRPVDLVAVIEGAIESVRAGAEAKGVRVETRLDRVAGVSGDADRLQQVVWNLLSNAVKFTPRGGRIDVRLERDDDRALIRVADTGKGVEADVLPHIFERFRQGDSTSTRTHGGLGIGLAIVRHFVELHGGTVSAESAGDGHGSTFTVELPVTGAPLPDAAPGARGAGDGQPRLELPAGVAGLHVLVVDDDPNTCDLLRTVLEDEGAHVVTATSAAEALASLDRMTPDALVSDISMPVEDGYALIQKVRARKPDRGGLTPALALTAYARTEDRERALGAGYQMHVPKPVAPGELLELVAKLVGRRAAR